MLPWGTFDSILLMGRTVTDGLHELGLCPNGSQRASMISEEERLTHTASLSRRADDAQARLQQHLLAADPAEAEPGEPVDAPDNPSEGTVEGVAAFHALRPQSSAGGPGSRSRASSRQGQPRSAAALHGGVPPMMAQDSALAEEPVRDGLEGAGRYGPGLPWPGVGGGTGATEDWGFKTLALKPGSASPASASLFPLPPGAQDRHQLRKDRVSSISQGSARLRVQSAGKNHGDGAQMLIFSSGSSVVSGSDGENRSSRSRDGGMITRPGSSFSSEAGGGRSGLIESRNARVQTEHHYQLLKARVAKLAFEEERANKTALLCKARAQDVLRLRQDVERRQQQRQQMREQQQSQESLDAKRRAELQQERRAARRLQSKGYVYSMSV